MQSLIEAGAHTCTAVPNVTVDLSLSLAVLLGNMAGLAYAAGW